MTEIDYLVDDPEITNQQWACISFITPKHVKGCKYKLIKFRGAYGNKDRAIDRCKELKEEDDTFNVYLVQVGKWIAWCENEDESRDLNSELNMLMKEYKSERQLSKTKHEERKTNLKESNNDNHDNLVNDLNLNEDDKSGDEVENNVISLTEDTKEIKYLVEDRVISNQKYFLISYILPEQLENHEMHNLDIKGFKIRQSIDDYNEAVKKSEYFNKLEPDHHTYVGTTGHWVQWSIDPPVENYEYANKDLNKIMKNQDENQEKARQFSEQNKNTMNESIENLGSNNISNIVNDVIKEVDEDMNLDELDDELSNINNELEDARKIYNEMLKKEENLEKNDNVENEVNLE